VSWGDAKAYVDWLSRKTGRDYRLLSEAEWEFVARACRAATCRDQIFWFGNSISPDRANYNWSYSYTGSSKAQPRRRTERVGSRGGNPFGLFDITGNVAQWVEDCWNATLADVPSDGSPRKSGDCMSHVLRGGSWLDEPRELRSAARKWEVANARKRQIGFRVARSLPR
jgi:formylglycine-generating enzyme required for sulfatase activity